MIKLIFSSSAINIIVMGFNFLFKVYLSHIYTKNELGNFYTFIDVVSIGVVLFAGFKDSLVVALDHEKKEKVLYIYSLSFLFLVLFVLLFESFYFNFLGFSFSYLSFFLFLLLNLLAIYFSYLNSGFKNYKAMVFENFIFTIGIILSFFLLYFFITDIQLLIIIYLIAYVVRIVYLWYFIGKKMSFEKTSILKQKQFLKNTIYSSLMYFFSGLFINLSGVVMLKLFNDTALLGEYQVVVRSVFFALVAVFVFPLNSLLFPKISEYIANKEFETLHSIYRKFLFYLLAFYGIVLVLMVVLPFLIPLVFPSDYSNASIYLNWMLPTLPLIAYTTFTLNIIKGFDRFDYALYIRIFGSIIFFSFIASAYMIGFGAKSVFFALDVSFVGMALMSWYYRRLLV